MTDHQFDELFRNRLKDYSSQVPENFWQRIQPEDKDRKGFIFWIWYLIVPVCLLSGVAGAYYYKSTGTRNTSSWSSATPTLSPRTTTYAALSPDHFSISAIPHTSSVIDPAAPSAPAANTTYHPSAATTSPAGSTANPPVAPAHSSSVIPLSPALPGSPGLPSASPNPPSTPPAHSDHTAHAAPPAHLRIYPALTSKARITTPAHHPDHLASAYNHNTDPVSNSGTDSATLTHSQLPGITPIPNIFHPLTIGKPQRTIANPTSPITKKTTTPIPSPKNNFLSSLKKGSWQLDVYASPDMPILQYKNSNEQTRLSFTAGLKINRSFGNHLSGTSGLQYSEVNTKLTHYDSSLSGPVSRTGELKITSLEFPLLIGYGIGNDRFRATFNTGMIFKIHSTGELHTTSTSLYFGVDLSKKINDKISLFAEPYYRYSLPGGYNSQYFIQRIHHTGLSLGIRYNFTKRQHKTYDVNQ